MKNLNGLKQYAIDTGDDGGVYHIPYEAKTLCVVASNGASWDHVSVSIFGVERCPKWKEMQHIKELFFEPSEVVMQLHPAQKDYINIHPYVLHLWRPQKVEIPLPPKIMV